MPIQFIFSLLSISECADCSHLKLLPCANCTHSSDSSLQCSLASWRPSLVLSAMSSVALVKSPSLLAQSNSKPRIARCIYHPDRSYFLGSISFSFSISIFFIYLKFSGSKSEKNGFLNVTKFYSVLLLWCSVRSLLLLYALLFRTFDRLLESSSDSFSNIALRLMPN